MVSSKFNGREDVKCEEAKWTRRETFLISGHCLYNFGTHKISKGSSMSALNLYWPTISETKWEISSAVEEMKGMLLKTFANTF